MITSGMNGAVYVIASQSGNLFFSWIIRNNGGNKRKECVIDMSSEITTIEQQQESGFKWVILISNILLLIFVCMGLTTWSVATEHLQEAFDMTSTRVMMGGSAFMLGFLTASGVQGRMIEVLGFKKAGLAAVLICVVASFLIPGCESWLLIIFLRFLMGFGMITPNMYYIIGLWFPARLRGFAFGLMLVAYYGGFALGGMMSGILVPIVGWKMTFYILAAVTLIGLVQWVLISRLPKGIEEEKPLEPSKPQTLESPKKEKSIFRSPALYWLALLYFVEFFLGYAYQDMTAVFFNIHGYNITQVGLLVFIVGTMGAISAPLGGIFSDALVRRGKHEPHVARTWFILIGGVIVSIIGCTITPFIAVLGFAAAAFCMMVVGWGSPVIDCVATATASDVYGPEKGDKAIGYMIFLGGMGGVISPILTTWVGENISWTLTWFICTLVALSGALACYKLMHTKREDQ